MAAAIFTLTKVTEGTLGRGSFGVFDFTSDSGDYAAGGVALTPTFASFNRYRREPSVVICVPNLAAFGFRIEYDQTTKKMIIRVATNAGTNAIEAEHSTATVVAAARVGARCLALWFTPVP
jgi:hypothetical protein